MKSTTKKTSSLNLKLQFKKWVTLVGITGFAQVLVQAIGFVSGILVIRLLPVEEYAFYTIANTMLGTMTILSDGGISTGVMSEGSKVWKDKVKLGVVLATGLDLRKKFALISIVVSAPILFYLLITNGASWLTSLLLFISIVPAFYAALSDSLKQIGPSLHQAILPLQKNQVGVGVGRLLLTTITLFAFPFAYIAVFASGIPRVIGNIRLKSIGAPYVDYSQKPDPKVRKELIKVVKKILPTSIYYAISGHITIWLISIFGNSSSVAQLGALGRFVMVFTLLKVIINSLIVPRFARMKKGNQNIKQKFIQLQVLFFLVNIVLIVLFYVFNSELLWILGDNYNNLTFELLLIGISGAVSCLSESTNYLLSSRGIIVPPIYFISIAIIVQITAAFLLPMGEVVGVIQYSIYTIFSIYLVRIIYLILHTKKNEFY